METTRGKRKSHCKSGLTKGATKPPEAASQSQRSVVLKDARRVSSRTCIYMDLDIQALFGLKLLQAIVECLDVL